MISFGEISETSGYREQVQKSVTRHPTTGLTADIVPVMVMPATPEAVRQARWRARQRSHIHVVSRVEHERDSVLQAMITAGCLSQTEMWRRNLIEREPSRLVNAMT
jgi:hypothetical protein